MFRRILLGLALCLGLALPVAGSAAPSAEAFASRPSAERFEARPLDTVKFPGGRNVVRTYRVDFPILGENYEVLDPYTGDRFNCISHSLDIHGWWVNPETGPIDQPLSRMDSMYVAKGYRRVNGLDFRLKSGVQKVVVYGRFKAGRIIEVTHAAIQDRDGTWSSKLGHGPLIRHVKPDALNGSCYGMPVAVYERPRA